MVRSELKYFFRTSVADARVRMVNLIINNVLPKNISTKNEVCAGSYLNQQEREVPVQIPMERPRRRMCSQTRQKSPARKSLFCCADEQQKQAPIVAQARESPQLSFTIYFSRGIGQWLGTNNKFFTN